MALSQANAQDQRRAEANAFSTYAETRPLNLDVRSLESHRWSCLELPREDEESDRLQASETAS